MKVILFIITSVFLFAAVGGQVTDSQAAISLPAHGAEIGGSHGELVGTWYSFPVGLMVRFNEDGSAIFGLDSNGDAVGYEADFWFENAQLHIRLNDFAGESDVCQTAVGVYEVYNLDSGGISFIPVADACQLRLNLLHGRPELDADLVFHPVS